MPFQFQVQRCSPAWHLGAFLITTGRCYIESVRRRNHVRSCCFVPSLLTGGLRASEREDRCDAGEEESSIREHFPLAVFLAHLVGSVAPCSSLSCEPIYTHQSVHIERRRSHAAAARGYGPLGLDSVIPPVAAPPSCSSSYRRLPSR